jgi:hypothetical protein
VTLAHCNPPFSAGVLNVPGVSGSGAFCRIVELWEDDSVEQMAGDLKSGPERHPQLRYSLQGNPMGEKSQTKKRQPIKRDLADRYRKIGIRAVAAAVRCDSSPNLDAQEQTNERQANTHRKGE